MLLLIILIVLFVRIECIRLNRKVVTKFIASQFLIPIAVQVNADSSFQDQLKVVQALQVEEQINRVDEERKIEKKEKKDLIGKGLVALPATSNEDVDPLSFPLGFIDPSSLDTQYSNKDATMIITAVGRNGPPVAAKKYNLNEVKFPFYFEITTDDLLFPYTKDAWKKSPLSKDSIAITAILDCDGSLSTPNSCERFGFAISDSIKIDDEITRTEAKITISLRSDGKQYDEKDLELLSRIDSELKRLGFTKI